MGKKGKCGIITFHRTANFGSCLQAYGLYRKIVDLGYDCELIDYRCPAIEKREGVVRKYPFSPKGIILKLFLQPVVDRKYQRLMEFLKNNTQLSRSVTPETISSLGNTYEKYFVGSDIVWGLDITEGDYAFFLDFVQDAKRKYAYASSVGNCQMVGDDPRVGQLLSSFQQIAVREIDAVDWVQRVSGRESEWVCDPTMLLTPAQWDAVLPPKQAKEKYVLIYFRDDANKCFEDAKQYAEKHGLKVYYINYSVKGIKGTRLCKPTSLQDFLDLLRNASFVFTASYHGMLFSLYYQKEFAFYTRAHSERVISLAQRLGVQDHCADQMDINDYKPVDYGRVEEKLQQFRDESTAVLMEMLEK